jgi:hypothetical protein
MAATDIKKGPSTLYFTLGWKERKAIRSVIKNGNPPEIPGRKETHLIPLLRSVPRFIPAGRTRMAHPDGHKANPQVP